MVEEKGRVPDYKGSGIDVWINKTKKGDKYLSVKVLGGKGVACFKFTPKPNKEEVVEEPIL